MNGTGRLHTLKSVPTVLLLALALTGLSAAGASAQTFSYTIDGNAANPAVAQPGVAAPQPQSAPNQPIPIQTIVAAGSVVSAELLNDLNSDIPGPVLAQVTSGPFAGGRAIGTFSKDLIGENGYITITFNKIVKDGVVYTVSATALDENTTLTGLKSGVNHHYNERFGLPAAAGFVNGYSQAMGTVGTQTITTAGGGLASSTPAPSPRQAIMQGLQASSGRVANELQQDANVPVTVTLTRGAAMSLLFTQSVTTGNAGQ